MKKLLRFMVAPVMAMALLAGCGTSAANTPSPVPTESAAAETPAPTVAPTTEPTAEVPDEKAQVNVAVLKGATAMGMVSLMDKNEKGEASNQYDFQILGTADEVAPKVIKGEIDIAAIPANLGSVLYNKTEGKIKVLAVNTLGVLYIVDTTGTVQSVDDLMGKTIYSVGKGTTPEFVLNYVLNRNGLVPGVDVMIEYKSEATELAALLENGGAEIAMLPEPFVTTVMAKNEKVKVALNMTEEWDKVQPEFALITGTVIVSTAFLEQNPQAVELFLQEYKESIEFVTGDVKAGAALVAKFEIVPSVAVAEKALPGCNIVYIDGEDMKKDVSGYLGVLFEAEPSSVGGKLPDDNYYYTK